MATGSVSYAQNFKPSETIENSAYFESVKTESNSYDRLTAFDSGLSNSIRSVRYQEVVTAIEDFLALLDDEQRAAIVLPFDRLSVVHIDRVVDGKVVEHWGQADLFAMMQQLQK